MFRFTIRDVLWLTALVAISCGWWLDQSRLKQEIERLTPKQYAMCGWLSDAELITVDADDNASPNHSADGQNPLEVPSTANRP